MKIISLNKAMEIAEKYIEEVPTKRTLSRYVQRGVLSDWKKVEHFGQQGTEYLYPNIIAAEIIVAVKLKGSLTLDEIARARAGEGIAAELYKSKLEEVKQMINK